jgi:hypothetical protein
MPRINSALFNFKPGTRDKKKVQVTFDFEPLQVWLTEDDVHKAVAGMKPRPYVPIVPPDLVGVATDIMEGNLTTTKWADEDATEFDFGGTP